MKHLWVKAGTKVFADGGKHIRYTCEDFPGVYVYSDAVFTPHANGEGGWMYHSYSVATSWGFVKMFRTLREAKAFVENGGWAT